jgi:hypothetical protein
MQCLFVGGPLDGELREVPSACIRTPAQRGRGPATFTITNLTLVPPEYVDYDIANGIARHESVSEEEVARSVYGFQEASRRWMNGEPWDAPQCESLAMTLHNPPDKP